MRVYLDNYCYNRSFDDQKQVRIRLEAEAKLEIQQRILDGSIELGWSYILDFENQMNPFEQRRMIIRQWRSHATVDTDETVAIIVKAGELVQRGLSNKDALHLACAISLTCEYFITTDDNLIRKTTEMREIKVTDPIAFIREEPE